MSVIEGLLDKSHECHKGWRCRCMCHQQIDGHPLAYHCMPCCETCGFCGAHYRPFAEVFLASGVPPENGEASSHNTSAEASEKGDTEPGK